MGTRPAVLPRLWGWVFLTYMKTRKPSCSWQTRATRCNVIVASSGGTPSNINEIYTSKKSTFSGLQFCRWQYGSISIRLAVIAFQMYVIAWNSKRIWPYSSARSSKVIDLGVNGKPICDFILVILVTLAVSATVFQIFTVKDRKLLILATPSLFDAP